MACHATKNFASVIAAGEDWRAVTRDLLEALPAPGEDPYTLGFLYVSDHLAADIDSMLSLIRSVTGIAHWTGAAAFGVLGNGTRHADTPAAAIMVARFPRDGFCVFPATDLTLSRARRALDPWLESQDPLLALVHGDPKAESDPTRVLAELERLTGGFLAGGMSSARTGPAIIADRGDHGGIGGVVFSSDVVVATTLTQGCAPLGPVHTVTRHEGNHIVTELDGRPAFEVFTDDLKAEILPRHGEDPAQKVAVHTGASLSGVVQTLFQGDVHVAFPVPGSDQRDYVVRSLTGADPESGCLGVPLPVEQGQSIMFVRRDSQTVETDLSRALEDLRARVIREHGQFAPQAALYISCIARSGPAGGNEMGLIAGALGPVPWVGFYANGEISNRRLYGYTGVLILFL